MGDTLEFFGEVFGVFWYFVYFVITSVIFIHEGLCRGFTILGYIVETYGFAKGVVAVIEPWVWLSCDW